MLKRIIFICLISNIASAACNRGPLPTGCEPAKPTCIEEVGGHFPSKTPPNYFGNSRSGTFNCAVTGADDLSMSELKERAKYLPESLDYRWYVRLGGNVGAGGVMSVKNVTGESTTSTSTISSTEEKNASNSYEVGFGYIWTDYALDIEWMGLNNVGYDATFTDTTPNLSFTTNVTGDAILINAYWIFKDLYNVKLYGLLCTGASFNKSYASLAGGPSTSLNRIGLAFGLGFGGRFNIISKIYADMAVRYITLGRVKYLAANAAGTQSMILKGLRTWFGVDFRLLWMI